MPDKREPLDTPEEQRERLWENFLSGKLDDAGAEELLDWLERDAAELEARRSDAAMHAGLNYYLGPPQQAQDLSAYVLARLKAASKESGSRNKVESASFSRSVMDRLERRTEMRRAQERRSRQNMIWISTLLAAGILLAVGLFFRAADRAPVERTEARAPTKTTEGSGENSARGNAIVEVQRGQATLNGIAVVGKKPAHVNPLSQIQLAPDSAAILTLNDGSKLELSDLAALTLLDFKQGPHVLLQNGQATVSAQKQPNGSVFKLETPHAVVAVVGTRYCARVLKKFSSVSVAEGSVAVTAKNSEKGVAPKEVLLKAGEEVRTDASGPGLVLRSARKRSVDPGTGAIEAFTNPAVCSMVPVETFNGLAIGRINFTRPANAQAYLYGGIAWPATLANDENRVEMWVRPRKVVPFVPFVGPSKLILLAQVGTTEYQIGELELSATDKDWMLLTGRIEERAAVNWIKPNTARIPLRPENIKHFALRSANADLEFDHTGIVIWKD